MKFLCLLWLELFYEETVSSGNEMIEEIIVDEGKITISRQIHTIHYNLT